MDEVDWDSDENEEPTDDGKKIELPGPPVLKWSYGWHRNEWWAIHPLIPFPVAVPNSAAILSYVTCENDQWRVACHLISPVLEKAIDMNIELRFTTVCVSIDEAQAAASQFIYTHYPIL